MRPDPTLNRIPSVLANGIEIEYEALGDPAHPALLLIEGLGGQMIGWPDQFCHDLVSRGFYVVRFDNRDSGLSSKIEGGPEPDVVAAYFGDTSSASYTLDDMADDAAGLLRAIDVEAAHLVGLSMGGMIAQTFAVRHPEKTLSLCSIMSTTGGRDVGQPTDEAMGHLVRPPATTREECAEAAVASHRLLGSPAYPIGDDEVCRAAMRRYDRAHYPEGAARQLCAILASGDRTERLAGVRVPTVVIHGTDDALIQPSGGRATADAIPGAELIMVEGMGHDLPADLWPRIVDAIAANAARAHGPR